MNHCREISEHLINLLYKATGNGVKPRTYRRVARKAYLAIAKQPRPGKKAEARHQTAIARPATHNLGHTDRRLDSLPGPEIPLSPRRLKQYWLIQPVYVQQLEMYTDKTQYCEEQIVSIHQPHVRPIIRGKQNKKTDFGAKISASLTEKGLAHIDNAPRGMQIGSR